MTKEQDVIDTRALELATQANTRVKGIGEQVTSSFNKIEAWQRHHEKHDDDRFEAIGEKISRGFAGVYGRMWIITFLIVGGLGSVAILLLDKAIP